MEDFDKERKYLKAKERVTEIKKFYGNLLSYIFVITFLAGINYYTTGWHNPWFLWPALGWGLGLIFHAIKTFQWSPFFNKEWEERKIREFMEEDGRNNVTKTQHWE